MPSPTDGGPPLQFTIPTNNSGRSQTLKVGRSVSIYWDLQPPNRWPETACSAAQFMLALDDVDVTVRWSAQGQAMQASTKTRHVWFVPPHTPHAAEWRGTGALLVVLVEPDLLREESRRELTEAALVPLAPFTQQDYLLCQACRRFHDLCHGRRSVSDSVALAEGTLVFAALVHAGLDRYVAAAGSPRRRGLAGPLLEKIAEHVEAHLRDNLTPAKLALAAGMSEHHFSRMFQRATGRTPMKYVWLCRVHHARHLLESGQWKVAAAAAESGFCDQSHLDRHFRAEFRCSPGAVIPPPVAALSAVSTGQAAQPPR